MTDDQRKELVQHILDELCKRKTRMTYSAVACLLCVHPRGMGRWLGEPRPEASWVVRKGDGRPTGYKGCAYHRDLYSKRDVIKSCCEMRNSFGVVHLPRKHAHGCEGGC